MSWHPFAAGVFAGGVLIGAVLFVLMVLSEARQRAEQKQAEDAAYERGFHRGWAEHTMCGRLAIYPSAAQISEMAKTREARREPTAYDVRVLNQDRVSHPRPGCEVFEVAGAGFLAFGNDTRCVCGKAQGCTVENSWTKWGYSGGVMDRREMERLRNHLTAILEPKSGQEVGV